MDGATLLLGSLVVGGLSALAHSIHKAGSSKEEEPDEVALLKSEIDLLKAENRHFADTVKSRDEQIEYEADVYRRGCEDYYKRLVHLKEVVNQLEINKKKASEEGARLKREIKDLVDRRSEDMTVHRTNMEASERRLSKAFQEELRLKQEIKELLEKAKWTEARLERANKDNARIAETNQRLVEENEELKSLHKKAGWPFDKWLVSQKKVIPEVKIVDHECPSDHGDEFVTIRKIYVNGNCWGAIFRERKWNNKTLNNHWIENADGDAIYGGHPILGYRNTVAKVHELIKEQFSNKELEWDAHIPVVKGRFKSTRKNEDVFEISGDEFARIGGEDTKFVKWNDCLFQVSKFGRWFPVDMETGTAYAYQEKRRYMYVDQVPNEPSSLELVTTDEFLKDLAEFQNEEEASEDHPSEKYNSPNSAAAHKKLYGHLYG